MIRTYFGLEQEPFHASSVELLPTQEEVLSTLRVHCQQGGLCVLLGQPGTGKSVIKQALRDHDPKMLLTPTVNRTLHTYHSVLRILCQAFICARRLESSPKGSLTALRLYLSPRPTRSTSAVRCLRRSSTTHTSWRWTPSGV